VVSGQLTVVSLSRTTGLWHSAAQVEKTQTVRSELPTALRASRGSRNSRHPLVRHSRAGGNPVSVSRAQALPGHGYKAEPGTEEILFLSSVAALAAQSKSALRAGLPAFDFAARSLS
jgi:hypothetical protein